MFRHPFVSEWHQQWHEREIDEVVRHRQLVGPRHPQHRIRRAVGQSIVSIGRRLAAEPVRSVARPR